MKNKIPIEILTPICTLVGVIIGAFVNIFLEFFRKKWKVKDELRLQAGKILQNLKSIIFTFSVFIQILERDFTKDSAEVIYDLRNTILKNIENIILILPEIKTFLFVYLTRLTRNKFFSSYEKSISIVEELHYNAITDNFFKPSEEIIRNKFELLQKNKNIFVDAIKFINKVENKYMSALK
jgi:hypothetical protein